jgi:CDGSH-type Zn-finger protein
MTEPIIAARAPFPIAVEDGKSYWWCSCGKSQKQPLCDGSHKGSTFTPKEYKATDTKTVYLCGCKHSAQAPLCDGSHKRL